jgi:hypothetical protein
MTTPERQDSHQEQARKWLQILELSRNILECAQRSDWEKVDAQASAREAELDAFFRQAVESTLVETVQKGIAEMMAQDEEIVRLVKKNREDLAREIMDLQAKRKQIRDYISNSE